MNVQCTREHKKQVHVNSNKNWILAKVLILFNFWFLKGKDAATSRAERS